MYCDSENNLLCCFRYNIQYARLDASEADVIAAAKSAEIHDRILTFPDKYESQVS